MAEVELAEYPREITQRFHGTPEQNAIALVGERPARWDHIVIEDYDPAWVDRFAATRSLLDEALGGLVIAVEHVGSTSVPGLAAKPIIDILLVVADPADEDRYVAPLEQAGYRLVIREPDWHQHRVLKGPDTDINLHVHAEGSPEISRNLRFRDHLRADQADRGLYQRAKQELAARHWAYIQQYADAKSGVVLDILRRS